MKIKVLVLSVFLSVTWQNSGKAEVPPPAEFARVVPPSPEASSLSRYAEFPVSYFYGLPQISVPLYDIKAGELTVPLSVSYHGGGIKVNETSGRVGLGWTLNAGGVITRSANGWPDEFLEGTYNDTVGSQAEIPIKRGFFRLFSPDKASIQWNTDKFFNYDPTEYLTDRQQDNLYRQSRLYFNFEGGYMDAAQDMFTFNFQGYSGTFMMNEPSVKSVVMQTESPVALVEMRFPWYFKFRDQNGFTYHFSEPEESWMGYKCYSPELGFPDWDSSADSLKYISAWYLKQITTPQGDTVDFFYSAAPEIKVSSGSFQACVRSDGTEAPDSKISIRTGTSDSLRYIPKRLDRIVSADTDISFVTESPAREDIRGDRTRLDYLIVKNRKEEIIKKYRFYYSYFYEDNRKDCNGLKLDSIYEFSRTGNASFLLHAFSYYGNGYRPQYNQDHWGYFKDGERYGNLVPPFDDPLFNTFECADRTPDKKGSLYATLTSITYPTGGKVDFEWEPNTYSYVGRGGNTVPENPEYREYTETLCGLSNLEKTEVIINIGEPQQVRLELDKYYFGMEEFMSPEHWPDYYADHTYGENIYFPHVKVWYLGKDGRQNKELLTIYLDQYHIRNSAYYGFFAREEGKYKITLEYPRESMNNVSGTGLLMLFTDPSFHGDHPRYGIIPVKYTHLISPTVERRIEQGGGLRIRRIHSHFGTDTVVKSYWYGDSDRSSGVLPDYMDYLSKKYLIYKFYLSPTDLLPSLAVDEVFTMSLNGIYRTPVGEPRVEYENVREFFGNFSNPETEASMPSIWYYYSTILDSPSYADEDETGYYQFVPPSHRIRTSKAHWRGNLKKKIYHALGNGRYEGRKEVYYRYSITEDPVDHYFTGGLFVISDFVNALVMAGEPGTRKLIKNDYGIARFRLIPYSKALKEQEEIEVTKGEFKDTVRTLTRYTYASWDYKKVLGTTLPLSVEQEVPSGKKSVTYYTYQRNPVGLEFTDRIATQVRVEDGYIVDAQRTEYDEHFRVKASWSMKIPQGGRAANASYKLGTAPDTPRELVNLIDVPEYTYTYDQYSRLKEIYYKGDIVVSYIWGYKGTYPIAEIKRKTASEVEQAMRSLGYDRTYFYLSGADQTLELERIREKLGDVEMTVMTYHWLIGTATVTDPRGVKTYYDYDDFGRLKDVKDYNNYLIRKYDYHYRNRNRE